MIGNDKTKANQALKSTRMLTKSCYRIFNSISNQRTKKQGNKGTAKKL